LPEYRDVCGIAAEVSDESTLLQHGRLLCGGASVSREMTPELKRALALKPKAEDFV
jgi:hypothetical protein